MKARWLTDKHEVRRLLYSVVCESKGLLSSAEELYIRTERFKSFEGIDYNMETVPIEGTNCKIITNNN